MTNGEALRNCVTRFRESGIDQASEEARVLLCHALGCSSAQLFARLDSVLMEDEAAIFEDLISRRIQRIPTAYITNSRDFYGMQLYVDSRVLIPRPETEILIHEAIRFSERWFASHTGGMRIADIGTGSGAIAIAMAASIPDCSVWATDVSAHTLAVATENAKRHGLSDRIVLVRGHLLEAIPEELDMVVANLPYIPAREVQLLPDEIRGHEPVEALSGGETGTEVVEELIISSVKRIRKGGALLLEIGLGQESRITAAARLSFPNADIGLTKDLSGIYRVVKIETEGFDNRIGLL